MMVRLAIVMGMVFSAAAVSAQDAKPAGDKPAAEKITYEQHVLPLLREKCGSCHNANDKKGDLVLDNFGAMMRGGASGTVVATDGDADGSILYRVVAHLSEPKMPPNAPKLPDENLALIKKWIEGGALENAGSTAKPKKTSMVAKVEVSNQRPAGPAIMPENLRIDPLLVSSRANGVTALATSPWAPLLAVSGHKQVLLYDTTTLDLVGVLPFPEGQPHVLKFSRNSQILMAAGGRGAHSGKVILFNVKTGQRVAEIGDEYDVILAADISPDQTMVALGGPKKIVRVYNVATGEQMYEKKKHTDWITSLEFSPDGVLLATADRSNGLIVWEAFTGREFYVLNGHTNVISDVSWSPDGNLLASACEDTTVRLWEMQNGTQAKSISAHGGGATSVEILRDGRIVTVGRDNVPKMWDAAGNNPKNLPGLPAIPTELAYCSETERLFAGDLLGNVHVFNGKDLTALGQLTTNPPALTARIEQARAAVMQTEAAAAQTAAQVAALQKGVADRKAAAEAATNALAEATAAVDPATKAKAAADADLVAKTQAMQTADTNAVNAQAAQTKAQGEKDAAAKTLADAVAGAKVATDAATAAEAAVGPAQQAAEAKPEDAAAKQAAAAAVKAATDTITAAAEATKKKAELVTQLAAKSDALVAANLGLTTAKA
ncbi:MAG TPA: c-type cytochrome domain-containing protein, partial [Planctomycetaceae bacterium]|nr:c-type cytochrome domain-containing protein [Planctomycetaceae bacterium]